jgi:hypothetical protein
MTKPSQTPTPAPEGTSAAADRPAAALDALADALTVRGLEARRIDRAGAGPVLAVGNPAVAELRDLVECREEGGALVFYALADPPAIRLGETVEAACAALGRMLATVEEA